MGSAESISNLHDPVMLGECLSLLAPALERDGAVLLDATLGLGGHTEAILKKYPAVRAIGLDRDAEALKLAGARLDGFRDRIRLFPWVYNRIPDAIAELGYPGVDAILFDLGVSSMQLDDAARGFSYSRDAPLDMRMTQGEGPTAADLIAQSSPEELTRILRDWGEERYAKRIARAIVEARSKRPITRSSELVEILHEAIPIVAQKTGGHPAKRTFQALRIAVNEELLVLADALPKALNSLKQGGRMAVLSYHSLEDRLVKQEFRRGATSSTPPGLPVEIAGHEPFLRLVTRGALEPGEEERERNPRARSAKLRVAERISTSREAA